jgi:hypothetical protein
MSYSLKSQYEQFKWKRVHVTVDEIGKLCLVCPRVPLTTGDQSVTCSMLTVGTAALKTKSPESKPKEVKPNF